MGENGGVFAYLQITGFALFIILFVARTVMLHARQHINPIRLRLKNKGWLGVAELSFFVWVNIWIAMVLLYLIRPEWQPFPGLFRAQLVDSLLIKTVGLALIVLALAIFILALITLGDSWRLGIDDRSPGALVTHGIYRLSRNPIYLFFNLYFLGTFLVNGAFVFLAFALLAALNLHYQVLQEEKFLAKVHGAAYALYYAKTPRYFSWRQLARHAQVNKAFRRLRQAVRRRTDSSLA